MKNKVLNFIKTNYIFTIFWFILLIVVLFLVLISKDFENGFLLLTPSSNLYSRICFIVITILSIFLYGFLIFSKKHDLKIENIFLAIIIPIGILYCISLPLGRIPDEHDHLAKCIDIANGNILTHPTEESNAILNISTELKTLFDKNRFYSSYFSNFFLEETNKDATLEFTNLALYAPICHLPQTLGILITRLFRAPILFQCYAARITNFAISTAIIYFAIKYIPFKKNLVVLIALLPISLCELISASSDALTISISLFWISYCMYLKYKKEKIDKKDITILLISSIVLSLCKIVYVPLCLIIFLLPKEKFGNIKNKLKICLPIFGFSILLNLIWLGYASRFLIEFNSGVNAHDQIIFILTHPISYLSIVFRTFFTYSQFYLITLMGTALSLLDVYINNTVLYSFIIFAAILFVTSENTESELKIDNFSRLIYVVLTLIIIGLIYTVEYVQWTAVKSPLIEGIQGRYFLPILLLSAFAIHNFSFKTTKNISSRYLFLILAMYNFHCITSIVTYHMY